MRWTDIADWIGPTRNEGDGDGTPLEPADAISSILGVVVHIQQGSETGTEAWQRNPDSQVSSHFLSPKVGRGRQMVDTADRAWAQVAGNSHWLSVENEGLTGQTLTADQIEFNAQVLAKAHLIHNVPLQVSNDPNVPGLCHHSAGGVGWGNHPDCPGNPVIAQKPAIVARAQEIVEEMTALDVNDPNFQALIWRIKALVGGDETVQGGPTKDEPVWLVQTLKKVQVTPTALQPGVKLAVTVDSVT